MEITRYFWPRSADHWRGTAGRPQPSSADRSGAKQKAGGDCDPPASFISKVHYVPEGNNVPIQAIARTSLDLRQSEMEPDLVVLGHRVALVVVLIKRDADERQAD